MFRLAIRTGNSRSLALGFRCLPFSSDSSGSWLSISNMNPKILKAEYAVRGELVLRAQKYEHRLKSEEEKGSLPFSEIIYCNIGNPQALGHKPLSFPRQVLSLIVNPDLLDAIPSGCYPADAISRAKYYLEKIPGGCGAYSESQGLSVVRDEVSAFLNERDGYPADSSDIFLTNGASPAVHQWVGILTRDEADAMMIPIPQYPLYSATLTLSGGSPVGYYLDESNGWGIALENLSKHYDQATSEGKNVRAFVVINPGNPTGQCLSQEHIKALISFCNERKMVILADEVYQENIYGETKEFLSFRKVLCDFQKEGKFLDQQLVSFHSVSKGFLGECGLRGGYMHLMGIPEDVKMEIYKEVSTSLCSNVIGQLSVGLMVNPPKPGDESYELYIQERKNTLESLKRRAVKLSLALNKLPGITCTPIDGAMYAFPQLELSEKAVSAAKSKNMAPDAFYCMELLDSTGIAVVPGSGFNQVPGTWHFRTTILPPEEKMDIVVNRMEKFHLEFMERYK